MKDATIQAKTGCNWERWVWVLDQAGAYDWSHRAIAEHVRLHYKTPMWWTQAVTVGYERIKGLRAMGQRRGGDYEAGKSKTLAAPTWVYRAFRDRAPALVGRRSHRSHRDPNKYGGSPGTGTNAEWYSPPKATPRQVAVQHRKFPTARRRIG
jgi:hypothetical protein